MIIIIIKYNLKKIYLKIETYLNLKIKILLNLKKLIIIIL